MARNVITSLLDRLAHCKQSRRQIYALIELAIQFEHQVKVDVQLVKEASLYGAYHVGEAVKVQILSVNAV